MLYDLPVIRKTQAGVKLKNYHVYSFVDSATFQNSAATEENMKGVWIFFTFSRSLLFPLFIADGRKR